MGIGVGRTELTDSGEAMVAVHAFRTSASVAAIGTCDGLVALNFVKEMMADRAGAQP